MIIKWTKTLMKYIMSFYSVTLGGRQTQGRHEPDGLIFFTWIYFPSRNINIFWPGEPMCSLTDTNGVPENWRITSSKNVTMWRTRWLKIVRGNATIRCHEEKKRRSRAWPQQRYSRRRLLKTEDASGYFTKWNDGLSIVLGFCFCFVL